jgi:protocatechuate 3,4-dioxygenase alpha subunit
MRHLQTVMFFSDAADPVLDAVAPARKKLLVGKNDKNTWRFDIRLRGDGETPFFED